MNGEWLKGWISDKMASINRWVEGLRSDRSLAGWMTVVRACRMED
jgi:hypothetical protein